MWIDQNERRGREQPVTDLFELRLRPFDLLLEDGAADEGLGGG